MLVCWQATIAKLGGVEPLIGLLANDGSPTSQEYAAGALSSLASKHSENRQTIAKRLVGLLNGKQVDRAVRVLSALASLSNDNPANQTAIAKVGGVPPVISWLSNSSEEAQREAAHAVLAIATNNATTQVSCFWRVTSQPMFSRPLCCPACVAGIDLKVDGYSTIDFDHQ